MGMDTHTRLLDGYTCVLVSLWPLAVNIQSANYTSEREVRKSLFFEHVLLFTHAETIGNCMLKFYGVVVVQGLLR